MFPFLHCSIHLIVVIFTPCHYPRLTNMVRSSILTALIFLIVEFKHKIKNGHVHTSNPRGSCVKEHVRDILPFMGLDLIA